MHFQRTVKLNEIYFAETFINFRVIIIIIFYSAYLWQLALGFAYNFRKRHNIDTSLVHFVFSRKGSKRLSLSYLFNNISVVEVTLLTSSPANDRELDNTKVVVCDTMMLLQREKQKTCSLSLSATCLEVV